MKSDYIVLNQKNYQTFSFIKNEYSRVFVRKIELIAVYKTKYKNNDGLYDVLEKIVEHYKSNNKIRIDIDFNPSQMM